jgi:hypothetical protein
MPNTCYQCRWLLQGGDGSNGCLRYGDPTYPGYPDTPASLDEPPTPLYGDCWEPAFDGPAWIRAEFGLEGEK